VTGQQLAGQYIPGIVAFNLSALTIRRMRGTDDAVLARDFERLSV
jgi:hypothetical protein